VFDYQLSKVKLARMAALIQAGRQFSYDVARKMAAGEGTLEASMVKAYVCRAAEWVTREAMQLHGGMGYAEEFPVSASSSTRECCRSSKAPTRPLCLASDRPPPLRTSPALILMVRASGTRRRGIRCGRQRVVVDGPRGAARRRSDSRFSPTCGRRRP
jgi:hypothetical protein